MQNTSTPNERPGTRYPAYEKKLFRDPETHSIAQGDLYRDGVIFRLTDGMLHDEEGLPAIESNDGYAESWDRGNFKKVIRLY